MVLDFANGTVVHINAGMAAVAVACLIGSRRNAGPQPNSVSYVVLGASILWFGFNAGSEFATDFGSTLINCIVLLAFYGHLVEITTQAKSYMVDVIIILRETL